MALVRGGGHVAEVERLTSDGERASPQTGEIEEIADEPLEPARLAADHCADAGRLEDPVLERLGMAADRGERCLELVADRQQERPLSLLCALELVREMVEGRCQRRGLSRPGDREPLGPLALCERTARHGHARDRPCYRTREEQRDEGGERRSDEAGQPEPERERCPVGGLARGRTEEDDRLVAVPARCIEEARAAHLEAAARRGARSDALGACAGEQERRLRGSDDREPLLVRGEELPELVLRPPAGIGASLGRDQLDLPLEGVDAGLLQRPSREEGSGDDGDENGHEHRAGDSEEEA